MNNAMQLLGVSQDSDANEIRKRYLELVRQFPPEKFPERFSEIHSAYEQLRDPLTSLSERLLTIRCNDTFENVLGTVNEKLRDKRIPTDVLLNSGK
ncbi:MAG: J domain-containing protein [Planctomycetaceae bacterium]|jgi:preprotein translocase subunit Sec63|nr:J domain-containing protein [Planctomycetaceae bacterium]